MTATPKSERQLASAAIKSMSLASGRSAPVLYWAVIGAVILRTCAYAMGSWMRHFDHIARAGETFRYTATGPEGLLKNKKAYVFAARGGLYVGTPLDTQTNYVRDFLRFVGIEDVEFVYAEGLAISPESKSRSLEQANDSIARLAA